jgi:transcriptional regulator with XRE-family HTH domain
MPRRNTRLKVAIIESGHTQREVARALGVGETRLSDLVTGTAAPRHHEEIALSELLARPVDWLFSDPADDEQNEPSAAATTA